MSHRNKCGEQEYAVQSLWYSLPYELVVEWIMGTDLIVFGKLQCVDKQLQKWLHAEPFQNGIAYANLLKYNFPATFCLLHELTYADQLETINRLASKLEYFMSMFQIFAYDDGKVRGLRDVRQRGSCYKLVDGVYQTSLETMLSCLTETERSSFLGPQRLYTKQSYQIGTGEKLPHAFIPAKRVYTLCREDAAKISRFFSFFTPFGYPDGSYYMQSHRERTSLMIEILRISLKHENVYKDKSINQKVGGTPLARFIGKIKEVTLNNRQRFSTSLYTMGVERHDHWMVEDILKVDFQKCVVGLKELTTERILHYWQKYLLPFMPPLTTLSCEGENKKMLSEDAFYYESIDNLYAFATRLTNISRTYDSNRPGEGVNRYGDTTGLTIMRLDDAIIEMKKVIIGANFLDNHSMQQRYRIDVAEIFSLCKEVRAWAHGNNRPVYVAGTAGPIDIYCIFRSFLYMELNKL